jgi:aspartate 1-decarboxylase
MFRHFLKSKIHCATVTHCELNGSAARRASAGDLVIIAAFGLLTASTNARVVQ